ncbi:MAG: hypothetical protein FK733_10300 [Asgard group archaeon]|nr:hypothetical protein [Asgard group archaeon]
MVLNYKRKLHQSAEYIIQGKFQDALNIVDGLLTIKELPNDDKTICLLLKCEIFNKIGEFNSSLKITNEVITKSKKLDNHTLYDILIQKGESQWRLGQYLEHFQTIEKSELILNNLKKIPEEPYANRQALLLYHKMVTQFNDGKFQEAYDTSFRGLDFAEKSKNELTTIWLNYSIANTAYYLDKDKISRRYITQGQKIAKKIGNKQEIAYGNHLLAKIYADNRDLKNAIRLREEAINLNEEIDSKRDTPFIYNELGIHYRDLLELETALECFNKYFEIAGEDSFMAHIPLSNIAYTYKLKGNYEQATQYYLKALKKCEDIGEKERVLPITLYSLANLALENAQQSKANEYIDYLNYLTKEDPSSYSILLHSLASAQIQKESKRLNAWGKAINSLNKALEIDDISHYWQVVILLNLAELLMKELYFTGEPEVLKEVKDKIDKIIRITQKNDFHLLLVQAYWLKAQIALAELNSEQAMKFLLKANEISEEKCLNKLTFDISKEQEKLETQLNNFQEMLNQKKPLIETLKHLSLVSNIKDITKEATLEIHQDQKIDIKKYKKIFDLKF